MLGQLIRSRLTNAIDPLVYSLPGNQYGSTTAAYADIHGIESALKNAASFACIRVMADALSRTPIDVVREVRGQSTPVYPTPKVIVLPSGMVTPDVWRSQFGFSIMTDGNVFASIANTDSAGRPTQLEILDPTMVQERIVEKGRARVRVGSTVHNLYPYGDIWHMPGDMVQPGTPFGLSPVKYAAAVIGTSLAAEDFSFQFFNTGQPAYALKNSSAVELDDAKVDRARAAWRRATTGTREPAIFGSAWSVEQFGINPNETQFIQLMQYCTEQACRVFGVPPTMIFASVTGQHMTYANVTQADLHFLKHALEGKFVRMESALTDILPGNDYSSPSVPNTRAVMRRSAILKADVASRYAQYAVGIQSRFLTVNEVRAAEDAPPFDGPEYDLPNTPPFGPTPGPLGAAAVPDTSTTAPTPDPDSPAGL